MTKVILIHGAPSKEEYEDSSIAKPSENHWFPWLQNQLEIREISCIAPEFPRPFDPLYDEWKEVLDTLEIDEQTILIGHSCGGGFILKYLSENKSIAPKQIILVAPWLDPKHEFTQPFFDFEIDSDLATRTSIDIFISTDDGQDILDSFEVIKKALPNSTIHPYTDKEHFCTPEFPEILEVIK